MEMETKLTLCNSLCREVVCPSELPYFWPARRRIPYDAAGIAICIEYVTMSGTFHDLHVAMASWGQSPILMYHLRLGIFQCMRCYTDIARYVHKVPSYTFSQLEQKRLDVATTRPTGNRLYNSELALIEWLLGGSYGIYSYIHAGKEAHRSWRDQYITSVIPNVDITSLR